METITIQKAERLGLCFGVRRAINLLKEAVTNCGEIETLGPVAHNRLLVEALANVGVKPILSLDEAQGRVLAITTHGTTPAVLSEIKARHIRIIDTTCPIVRRAQNAVRKLAEAGFHVVIFGNVEHSEVKGLLGWGGKKTIATLDIEQIASGSGAFGGSIKSDRNSLRRLGIISQTTRTLSAFTEFATQLIRTVGSKTEEIRVVNTLCKIIQGQQEAAVKLAGECEVIIVIGGGDSANARHLIEICSPLVETHLVETPDEVDIAWLAGKHHIGITAGASTPDEAVEALITRLRSLCF